MNKDVAENALQSYSQFCYKTNHSTETMMVGLVDDVLMEFDNNQCTILIFRDLSAALDTIDQTKLVDLLETEMGVTGVSGSNHS